jgi:hypothetical protein
MAMSAATILAMSGDEILMDDRSSLGPIDPQIQKPNAIPYPAQSYLDYLDQVAEEEASSGKLSLATLAILSRVTPADIQIALDATEEARLLVRSWLRSHMWATLKGSDGSPVGPAEIERKAKDVAESLASHKKWLNHGKMLSRSDLLRVDSDLRLVDYSKLRCASDLWELWVNLHYSFGIGSSYKVYESACSRIVKSVTITGAPMPQATPMPPGLPRGPGNAPSSVIAGLVCPNCGTENKVQADFEPGVPPNPQAQKWPAGDRIKCTTCQTEIDLRPVRMELKRGLGRDVVTLPSLIPGPTP